MQRGSGGPELGRGSLAGGNFPDGSALSTAIYHHREAFHGVEGGADVSSCRRGQRMWSAAPWRKEPGARRVGMPGAKAGGSISVVISRCCPPSARTRWERSPILVSWMSTSGRYRSARKRWQRSTLPTKAGNTGHVLDSSAPSVGLPLRCELLRRPEAAASIWRNRPNFYHLRSDGSGVRSLPDISRFPPPLLSNAVSFYRHQPQWDGRNASSWSSIRAALISGTCSSKPP